MENNVFINIITLCLLCFILWNLTTYVEKPFYKSNKPCEAMVYSEFITAKGVLTTPLSGYKFTVNHGFLGLIDLFWGGVTL